MVEAVFFYILAALALSLGFLVVVQTNPLASAMAMVGTFAALAALYALLSAPLVAALQVLVYAGGIMVLMIFVIMLLDLRNDSLRSLRAKPAVVAACLAATGIGVALPLFYRFRSLGKDAFVSLGPDFGSLKNAAALIFGTFLFPFEMLSLVFLAALVGALVLTKKRL